EPFEAALGEAGRVDLLRHEPLAGSLLGDPHRLTDLGPRGTGAASLVDEVPDEVVGELAEVIGGDDRAGELLEDVGMDRADGVDEIVEANGGGDRSRFHTTTLSCRIDFRQPSVVASSRASAQPRPSA